MTAFPAPEIQHRASDRVPDGAVRLDALHNIGTAEGIHVWRYESGHPMTRVFATVAIPRSWTTSRYASRCSRC